MSKWAEILPFSLKKLPRYKFGPISAKRAPKTHGNGSKSPWNQHTKKLNSLIELNMGKPTIPLYPGNVWCYSLPMINAISVHLILFFVTVLDFFSTILNNAIIFSMTGHFEISMRKVTTFIESAMTEFDHVNIGLTFPCKELSEFHSKYQLPARNTCSLIGTSVRRSSRLAFWRPTGNDVSGH